MTTNGVRNGPPSEIVAASHESRADEVQDLIQSLLTETVPFIRAADDDEVSVPRRAAGDDAARPVLVEQHSPDELRSLFQSRLDLPEKGLGKDGLISVVRQVLELSVNTWAQGFLDKLYASTNAVGLVAELLLATLNTNVHVYTVSPALTLIERATTTQLATLFGFTGPNAGGISQPGGSASNTSSIVIARNTLFPETKEHGNGARRFVLFTSAHGHYSVEKAAQMLGFGSKAVIAVAVDANGLMRTDELERAIVSVKEEGKTPFYVNATAGTTVLGSFDPFDEIADICQHHKLWLHVDGSWGGSVVFSKRLAFEQDGGRLHGVQRADSIAVTPHKMLGVPMTCSFLLGRDMRQFWRAMTLPAGYLFHNEHGNEPSWDEIYDLADLTPQCGRRGDSLKMFLSWSYYGAEYYRDLVERAFDTASYFYDLLERHPNFELVTTRPVPCLQVCYYYVGNAGLSSNAARNSARTAAILRQLVPLGFLIDYAPGEKGKFFRVVVNGRTRRETLKGLIEVSEHIGRNAEASSE